MSELYTNYAMSTLASGITAGATSLTVATGEGARFPTKRFWIILADTAEDRLSPTATREFAWCSSRSGDVLTVERGLQDSTASAWDSGDRVEARLTMESLNRVNALARSFRSGFGYINPTQEGKSVDNLSQNKLMATPTEVGERVVLTSLGVEVTTAVASSVIRLGLYADDHGYPGALIIEAGTIDGSSTGGKDASISLTLEPGVYWTALQAEGGGPSIRTGTSGLITGFQMPYTLGSAGSTVYAQSAQTPGSLVDPFPTGLSPSANKIPHIYAVGA